ncbi:hypothetical protein [Kribbella monticola]|uniref:hypothetical protein n=1 Tax=Kribbella monticola TaxID=2185285 RepID=UPI000DD437DC|nr:hypothetical protein [Kribbella monticola]
MASPLSRVNVRADAWELLWSFAHRVLAVNLVLAVAGLPLMLALGAVDAPLRYPLFFGLLALPLGPAAAGAFAYFALDDPRPPVSALLRLVLSFSRRALAVTSITAGLTGVLLSDLKMLNGRLPGAAVVPLLVVLLVLVLTTSLTALVLVAARPDLRLGALLRLAVYTGVRGWPLSLLSLGVLALALVIVSQVPLAGLAVVPGCALWVVATNSSFQLRHISAPPS